MADKKTRRPKAQKIELPEEPLEDEELDRTQGGAAGALKTIAAAQTDYSNPRTKK